MDRHTLITEHYRDHHQMLDDRLSYRATLLNVTAKSIYNSWSQSFKSDYIAIYSGYLFPLKLQYCTSINGKIAR